MEIVKGNYGYDIGFTVYDKNNVVVDLTGVTKVVFNVADIENHRNMVTGDCAAVNYSTGQVKYTVQPDDFKRAGVFVWSLQLQYPTKVLDTLENYVTVREKLSL